MKGNFPALEVLVQQNKTYLAPTEPSRALTEQETIELRNNENALRAGTRATERQISRALDSGTLGQSIDWYALQHRARENDANSQRQFDELHWAGLQNQPSQQYNYLHQLGMGAVLSNLGRVGYPTPTKYTPPVPKPYTDADLERIVEIFPPRKPPTPQPLNKWWVGVMEVAAGLGFVTWIWRMM